MWPLPRISRSVGRTSARGPPSVETPLDSVPQENGRKARSPARPDRLVAQSPVPQVPHSEWLASRDGTKWARAQ
eukprot:8218740-Prorocentrum_lima.AAC.1